MKQLIHEVSFHFQDLSKNYFVVFQDSPKNHSNGTRITEIKCIPQQSNWAGGDEIAIIMPSPIKRKGFIHLHLSIL